MSEMGLIRIMERGGDDYREYKWHLKNAKKSIEALCELTKEMEDEYGYGERGYSERDYDRDEMSERGGRSMRRRYM